MQGIINYFGFWESMLYLYIIVINIIAFTMMGIDKRRAVNHKWRISENSLILAALVGGSFGAMAGMFMFKHKLSKKKFYMGIPFIHILISGIQVILIHKL